MAYLIVLICFFVQFPAQDFSQRDVLQSIRIRSFLWDEGKPEVATLEMLQVQAPEFFASILQKEVQKEIEVTLDQSKKLEKWIQSVSSFQARWMRLSAELDKQKFEEFKKQLEDFDEELVEILVPLQIEDLGKIRNRVLLRQYGWKHFLKNLANSGKLELDANELKSVNDVINAMRNEVDVAKLLSEVTAELFEPMSESQELQVKQFVEIYNVEITQPDLFLAQSKYALRDLKVKFGVETENEFRELLIKRPSFNFFPDGSFKSSNAGEYSANFAHFVANLSPEERDALELDDSQRQFLDNCKDTFWNEVRAAQKVRNAGKVTKAINDVFLVKMGDANDKFDSDSSSALSERQIAAIRERAHEKYAKQFGLIALILHGDLGRKIKFTKKEEDEFREIVSDQIGKIEKQLIEWDNELLARIHKELSPSNRRKLDEIIGRKLTYVVPTFEMILR